MEILYISYGEFFKVTCTAVQELYRSSLYSPGKYVNWNLSFFNGDPVY